MESPMNLPEVVSPAEWRRARIALLEKEKEHTRARDALNAERRRLPMVEIEKAYCFEGPEGTVALLDLFHQRRQLIIYHFMFDPRWDAGCPSCSWFADSLGDLSHLHARDTTLVMVSRAPFSTIEAYRDRMGWDVPWYSSHGTDFNYDFHVTIDKTRGATVYNYRDLGEQLGDGSTEGHGLSTFVRNGDQVFHTYSTYARGAEVTLNAYTLLDFTALGRQEDWEEPAGRSDGPFMHWVRRHDEYEPKSLVEQVS